MNVLHLFIHLIRLVRKAVEKAALDRDISPSFGIDETFQSVPVVAHRKFHKSPT
jgi:hypothetical protein